MLSELNSTAQIQKLAARTLASELLIKNTVKDTATAVRNYEHNKDIYSQYLQILTTPSAATKVASMTPVQLANEIRMRAYGGHPAIRAMLKEDIQYRIFEGSVKKI